MCNLDKAGLGLQFGSSLLSALGAKKEEKAYFDYSKQQAEATLNNYLYQSRALNNRYAEEKEASALETQQIQIQNMRAKATAEASAASMGIEGKSLDDLYRDYDRATAASNYVAAKNLHYKGLQYQDELDSLRLKALSSINLQQQYTGASFGASLLGSIGTMLSGYARTDYYNQRLKQERANASNG